MSAASPPRVAIVGAGLMGRWHAAYVRRSGGTVAAVVDRDLVAARALAARSRGAAVYGTDGDWPEIPGIDVVHICTPLSSHAAIAAAALDAGCHVVVEKPVAASLDETRRLLDLAARRRRSLLPVHQLPFQRGLVRLRHQIGRLGDLVDVCYRAFTAGAERVRDADRQQVLLEILPHPVSLFRALGLGQADWRLATRSAEEIVLEGEGEGPRRGIHLSTVARPTRHELVATGTRGSAVVDLFHGYCLFDCDSGANRISKVLRPFRHGSGLLVRGGANLVGRLLRWEPAYPGLPQLLAAFYRALQSDGREVIEASEMLAAAALIEKVAGAPMGTRAPVLSDRSRT